MAKLERMEKNLQRLVIEEEISFEDFKEHRSHIEAERAKLKNSVDVIRQRQHLVKADFEIALQPATELDFLFDRGNFDEKRLLCETMFKRPYTKDGGTAKTKISINFLPDLASQEGSKCPHFDLFAATPKDGKISKIELNSPFALIATEVGGSESVSSGGRYWI